MTFTSFQLLINDIAIWAIGFAAGLSLRTFIGWVTRRHTLR